MNRKLLIVLPFLPLALFAKDDAAPVPAAVAAVTTPVDGKPAPTAAPLEAEVKRLREQVEILERRLLVMQRQRDNLATQLLNQQVVSEAAAAAAVAAAAAPVAPSKP